jgi:hypothetical protein
MVGYSNANVNVVHGLGTGNTIHDSHGAASYRYGNAYSMFDYARGGGNTIYALSSTSDVYGDAYQISADAGPRGGARRRGTRGRPSSGVSMFCNPAMRWLVSLSRSSSASMVLSFNQHAPTSDDQSRPVATAYVQRLEIENEFLRGQIGVKQRNLSDCCKRLELSDDPASPTSAWSHSRQMRGSLFPGKRIFEGGDKRAKLVSQSSLVLCRDKAAARKPAKWRLCGQSREISIWGRLRGGAERTQTACQARSRYRTGLRRFPTLQARAYRTAAVARQGCRLNHSAI